MSFDSFLHCELFCFWPFKGQYCQDIWYWPVVFISFKVDFKNSDLDLLPVTWSLWMDGIIAVGLIWFCCNVVRTAFSFKLFVLFDLCCEFVFRHLHLIFLYDIISMSVNVTTVVYWSSFMSLLFLVGIVHMFTVAVPVHFGLSSTCRRSPWKWISDSFTNSKMKTLEIPWVKACCVVRVETFHQWHLVTLRDTEAPLLPVCIGSCKPSVGNGHAICYI